MPSSKKSNVDFEVEIGSENAVSWSKDKFDAIQKLIKSETEKKSNKERLEVELRSIQYLMEDYVERNEIKDAEKKSVETFVKLFLDALDIKFKKFALSIDTTDGNLKKYVSGERRLNTNLALKFAHFFHTQPDLWLKVQMKNELEELEKEKEKVSRYRKYDYEKLIS